MFINIINTRKESNIIESKKRDYLFDNLKALLIILVVFGHVMERFGVFPKIRGIIYVFHMPFFIFISGYFSKNTDKIENKLIKNLLIPFFIFNAIYMLSIEDCYYTTFQERLKNFNIFRASYLYWYLISLFIWRILTKYIVKFKFSIIILFILSLYIGLVNEAGRFLSISRTIAFFPFFMLGYYTDKIKIEKIRDINKKVSIFVLIVLISITFILSNKIIDMELFKNAQSYKYSNVRNLKGICVRIYQFAVAAGISMSLINLISPKNNWMSSLGKKTISIYILSPFIQEVLYAIVKILAPDIIGNNVATLIICMIISCIIICVCSLEIVHKTYNKFIDIIYKFIIYDDSNMSRN